MRIAVLGPVQAVRDGADLDLGPHKQRALLAGLVLHAGRVVPVETLTDLLWGDAPPAAVQASLHGYVAALRRVLEPGRAARSSGSLLVTRGSGYLLDVPPDAVDDVVFTRRITQAHRLLGGDALAVAAGVAATDLEAIDEQLATALALWRGLPYAELPGAPDADAERARLAELRSTAEVDRGRIGLAMGRPAEVAAALTPTAHEQPLREDVWALLALALARAGRQADSFATMTRSGVPLAWPAVCLIAPDGGTVTLATSVALPRKALNIRRDPRVALLFSDSTGTGRDEMLQVLVQGTATCPEEIVTSPAWLEEYWLRLWERQPGTVDVSSALTRRLLDFYYFRLVITVTPHAIRTRRPLARTPGVAIPTSPAVPAPRRGDRDAWAEATRRLGGYPDAVLGTAADGEPPDLRRVRVTADPETRLLRLSPADGVPVPASLAGLRGSLLFHGHDERLSALRQFGVLGTLVPDAGGVALRPERFVPGTAPESPVGMVRTVLRLRRTTKRYLSDRGLDRPSVDWDAFERLTTTHSPRP